MSYVTEVTARALNSTHYGEGLPGNGSRDGWHVVGNSEYAQDFNKGANGQYIYIYYRLGNTGPGLTGLQIIKGENTHPPEGWTKLPQNLNEGTKGEPIYLYYQKAPGAPQISDLKAGQGDSVDSARAGLSGCTEIIPQNTNEGAGGDYVYLGYTLGSSENPHSISITAYRDHATAAPGKPFPEFTITVKKDGKPVGEGVKVTLLIHPSDKSKATFEASGDIWLLVKTNASGQSIVDGLKAATGAKKGETFTITATTDGLQTPTVFTGTIGDAATIADIHAIGDKAEAVLVGQPFQNKLQVKVAGAGVGGAEINFKITAGNHSAFFVESKNETKKDEYTAPTGNDGIVEAHLQALTVPGTVSVKAWPLADPSKTVTFQDREVKPVPFLDIKLPAGARPDDVAVAPDGTAWVAGRVGDAGSVLSIAPGGDSKLVSYKLPDIPQARGHRHPSHVALELRQNGTVAAVWVSDLHTGFVYRLEPGDVDGHKVQVVDLGAGSALRGIAWDESRKLVWVADERGRLLAIDAEKKAENKDLAASRRSSEISDVAVTKNGVWFTEFATGKVCFLDASKDAKAKDRIKEFDFKITTKDEVGNILPTSYPSGLAVAGDRVWIITGFADSAEGSLWFVDAIPSDAITPPQHVKSFGKDAQPSDIAVDAASYLWVTLSGAHKAIQLTDTAMLVDEYDLGEHGVPNAIATSGIYADVAGHDQIWICDAQKDNPRVVRLTPIDQIAPALAGKVHISGQPEWGFVAQGKQLEKLTVKVTDDHNNPLERHVILNTDAPTVASFGGHFRAIVKTDKTTGQVAVESVLKDDMLKVATGAANGDQFTVRATTRGAQPGPDQGGKYSVYEGHVGEPVAAIHLLHHEGEKVVPEDEGETVALGTEFKNLVAQLTGPGGANADVVFRIEDGTEHAQFAQGKAGDKEYSTKAGHDGIAQAGLRALDEPGDVSVSVYPKGADDRLSATFKPRHVVPLPDKIEGSTYMGINVGEQSDPYTIKVTSNYHGQEVPVPHVAVQVRVQPVSGAEDVYVMEKGKSEDEEKKRLNREGRITTDENGVAKFGKGSEAWILSPSTGTLDVHFLVIQPLTSKAEWKLKAEVQRQ